MTIDGTLSFARRWSVVGLLGSAILWLCWFGEVVYTFYRNDYKLARTTICADHLAFYTGARLTRFGGDDKLFDYFGFIQKYQASLFEPDVWQWVESFRNPPFYALLYWPTCGLPYAVSAAIWFGISGLLTALGTWWLTDDGRYLRRLLWVFSFYGTFAAFNYGQNTPISHALFAATFVLLRKERPFAAGLVAGLLLYKPNLLLGLGVWALLDIRRKWPCALGVLITGSILTAISFLVLPTATHGFIESFNTNLKFDSFEHAKMHNPLAFIRLLMPADKMAVWIPGEQTERVVRNLHYAFAAGWAAAAIFAFVVLYRRRRDDVGVMFGGAIFLTLFANPHALIYEWMLLAITGLLWRKEWRDRPNTWFALYAAAWGVLLFSTELSLWALDYTPIMVQCSIPVLAGVGWYAVNLLTKSPVDPPPP